MSWKSYLTAGLLCVLATPVFADPNMALVSTAGTTGSGGSSGHLNAAGNWIWTVQVTPDLGMVPDASGTPVGIELGFTSTSTRSGDIVGQGNVLSAARNPAGGTGSFDTLNPGAVIFGGWQTGIAPAGNALLDPNSNNRPTGIQLNAPGVGTTAGESYTANSSVSGSANQVFAALGSVNFTTAGAKNVMNIVTQRPVVTAGNTITTTTIQVGGVYGTGSTNGKITQVTGLTGSTYTTSDFTTFGGTSYSFTMTAKGGDTNLDGTISIADYSTLGANYNQPGVKHWFHGDFNGDNAVTISDYSMLAANFGSTPYNVGPVSPGAGSGGGLSGGNVPEPASIALLGLACLGGLGVIRRKR